MGRLSDQLAAPAIHPKLGLLSADEPIDSPWLTAFELQAHMPWREKRVRQWLRAHDAGLVEVKTRGRAVDPDPLQKRLRGRGNTSFTVFVLRWDRQRIAMIARRACGP